jgi:hypothetical protein
MGGIGGRFGRWRRWGGERGGEWGRRGGRGVICLDRERGEKKELRFGAGRRSEVKRAISIACRDPKSNGSFTVKEMLSLSIHKQPYRKPGQHPPIYSDPEENRLQKDYPSVRANPKSTPIMFIILNSPAC